MPACPPPKPQRHHHLQPHVLTDRSLQHIPTQAEDRRQRGAPCSSILPRQPKARQPRRCNTCHTSAGGSVTAQRQRSARRSCAAVRSAAVSARPCARDSATATAAARTTTTAAAWQRRSHACCRCTSSANRAASWLWWYDAASTPSSGAVGSQCLGHHRRWIAGVRGKQQRCALLG